VRGEIPSPFRSAGRLRVQSALPHRRRPMSRAPRARAAAARARARSQLLAGVVSWPGRKRRGHAPMCLENAIGTAGTFRALHPLISAGNQVDLIASRSKAAPRPSWCKESAVAISLGKRPLSRCPVRLPFLETDRTLCVAPPREIRTIFGQLRAECTVPAARPGKAEGGDGRCPLSPSVG
jgi:hypothetical protein